MPSKQRLETYQKVARKRQSGLTLIIEDVIDPHNLAAITRTCDSFGVQQIHVIFEKEPEFDPKEVGKYSSTSTNKWIDYRIHHSSHSALSQLKNEGWTILATVLDEEVESIYTADLRQSKLALLFGNEKIGLSEQAIALADRKITIPMIGVAQSMNVSVAAGLFLYEITRQRRLEGMESYMLDESGVQETVDFFISMQAYFKMRGKQLRDKEG